MPKLSEIDNNAHLKNGLYDHLVTEFVQAQLGGLTDPRLAHIAELDAEDAHAAIAQYLEHLLASSLSCLRGKDAADRQHRLVDRVIQTLSSELGEHWDQRFNLADPLRRLLAVHVTPDQQITSRPDTPLARSALLTGTRFDPSLANQLSKEFATADRVDILCSFIKWSGIRLLLDALGELTRTSHPYGPRLRVISTSYMGATDPKAIEAICELPNTEVKVSYDTQRTRLHAKAYLIHRDTGFGSAYIGSANISHAALSDGLEWTSKISQYELAHLWQKISATFETYWNDEEFEQFGSDSAPRLREAIDREKYRGKVDTGDLPHFDLRPYPFQEEILDVLAAEREVQGKARHLVVAATGTGKTMISAFDYKQWSQGERPSLLYIAHREEILPKQWVPSAQCSGIRTLGTCSWAEAFPGSRGTSSVRSKATTAAKCTNCPQAGLSMSSSTSSTTQQPRATADSWIISSPRSYSGSRPLRSVLMAWTYSVRLGASPQQKSGFLTLSAVDSSARSSTSA